ncbi:hypothetical protein HRG84_23110 [Flavisolibacter sp. BT320]|nr:hypothetical protein [Flavisolibacter longurius]
MHKILIISPHYPPSNLAAVHRSRLFAQHLPAFGWEPFILTVDESFYEETLDHDLQNLLPPGQQIEKVKAYPVTKPRLIGDIGLRAFFQLRKKALEIIKRERIDFVYIPIPSFYAALIGPWLRRKTGVPYGIDYIDPWVHRFPGSEKILSRHWWSTKLSGLLERSAVKKASMITGVAEGYYKGVQDRNPQLLKTCSFCAMPYGGEALDHDRVKETGKTPYLFSKKNGVLQLVYAGAFLPKAAEPLKIILEVISKNRLVFNNVEFHFIGTGRSLNDTSGYSIKPLAEKYGLWNSIVFEYPERIPFLDVLVHLEAASGIFILGSTEPHYTPSKLYQGVLSNKPVWAALHWESSACEIIHQSNTGITLSFNGEEGLSEMRETVLSSFADFRHFHDHFVLENRDLDAFHQYSAYAVTEKLSMLLNSVVAQPAT